MRKWCWILSAVLFSSVMIASAAVADDGDDEDLNRGPIFNVVHFDVIPITLGGVDFLQNGYSLLFKYRDQSLGDVGLQSFRVLNLLPPTINHSEIVEVWNSYHAYKDHLAQGRLSTVAASEARSTIGSIDW